MRAVVAVLALAVALVAASEADVAVDSGKPQRTVLVGRKHVNVVYPRVDKTLLRSSPNVVLVPKGDPRARAPQTPVTAAPTAPAALSGAMQQKTPRNPKKPHVAPANPASSSGGGGSVIVGAAAAVPAAAPVLKAAAPTYASAACTAKRGTCKATSSCSGTVVKGICPGPATITCCTPKGTTPSAPTGGSNCLSGFNPSTFASRALAYQQSYRSHGVTYSQSSRQFGASPPVRYADCSSFVTSVLDSLGWNCLFASGRYTAAMIPIMRARGGFHSTPKTGDIVMWSGHTGIVVQACAGGKVRMVAMGTHGCADTSCITVASLKGWGAGTFLGFWTPK